MTISCKVPVGLALPEDFPLGQAVEALCSGNPVMHLPGAECARRLPSRDALVAMVEDLRTVLFPGYFGAQDLTTDGLRYHMGATLDRVSRVLLDQIERGYAFNCTADHGSCQDCARRAREAASAFILRLPEIRRLLRLDAQAAYEGDPAARSPDEAIFCYPGMMAITNHRIAHELVKLNVPLIPRIISEHAHSLTGIDIHPGATIGERFFMDHGTGIVIGETAVIGSGVQIYQGVTLGAKSFPLDDNGNPIKGVARHPIVEDNVVIYAGATVLGRITVGSNSMIGGNTWVTQDVPPNSRVTLAGIRTS